MKKIILLFTVILLQTSFLYAQEETSDKVEHSITNDLNWISSYDDAQKLAKEQNKQILIFFTGSDWCGLCKLLKKDFFSSDEFKAIAHDNLILYKADFPRRTDIVSAEDKKVNEALDNKYSKSRSKRSFPTIVITNANGVELGFIESYNFIHDTTNHFRLLKKSIQ
ncbi:MAG: thioredoxin family protein [Flavobacteriaceae bacterium]